jgi:hypothetical protein
MWHACERREKCTKFWWESPKERDHSQKNGIRKDLREISWEGVNWIQLAQDRGWWIAFVNAVMNLWVLAQWI